MNCRAVLCPLSDGTFRSGLVVYLTMPDDSSELIAQLRAMVARLHALALNAQEAGDISLSEQIVTEAIECDDSANALEAAAQRK
jgi:hypothetical protein